MRKFRSGWIVSVTTIVAACSVVPVLLGSTPALADVPGNCNLGTSYTTGLTLSVNGVSQPFVSTGVYGQSSPQYTVSMCRDTSNSAYQFSVGLLNTSMSPNTITALTNAQLTSTFTLSFTAQLGDSPTGAEGHASITSFSVNASTITISAQPLSYADIYQCNEAPSQCVIDHSVASALNPATLSGAVRYGTGFGNLPGMTLSSAAYYFSVGASCPTNSNRDQSYSGIRVAMGGPHFQPDGSTPNTGSVSAFLPAAAVQGCFNQAPDGFASNLSITRAENGTTTAVSSGTTSDSGLHYTVTSSSAGVTIAIPSVTFSQPTYTIATASSGSTTTTTATNSATTTTVATKAISSSNLNSKVKAKVTIPLAKLVLGNKKPISGSVGIRCSNAACTGTLHLIGTVKVLERVKVKQGKKTATKSELKTESVTLGTGAYKIAKNQAGSAVVTLTATGVKTLATAAKKSLPEILAVTVKGGATVTKKLVVS